MVCFALVYFISAVILFAWGAGLKAFLRPNRVLGVVAGKHCRTVMALVWWVCYLSLWLPDVHHVSLVGELSVVHLYRYECAYPPPFGIMLSFAYI